MSDNRQSLSDLADLTGAAAPAPPPAAEAQRFPSRSVRMPSESPGAISTKIRPLVGRPLSPMSNTRMCPVSTTYRSRSSGEKQIPFGRSMSVITADTSPECVSIRYTARGISCAALCPS